MVAKNQKHGRRKPRRPRNDADAISNPSRGHVAGAKPLKQIKKTSKKSIESMDLEQFLATGGVEESCNPPASDDDETMSAEDEELDAHINALDSASSDEESGYAGTGASENADSDESESDADEISLHKHDLEKLKNSQPDFYEYLAQNDAELLNFGEESEVEEEADLQDAEDHAEEPARTILTSSIVNAWKKELQDVRVLRVLVRPLIVFQTPSAATVKRLVVAFRSAVKPGDYDKAGYIIESPSLHKQVLVLVLKHVPLYFDSVIGPTTNPTSAPKWRKISRLAQVFYMNIVQLLKDLTDATMIEYLLQSVYTNVRFLVVFPKSTKTYFRLLLSIWGTADEDTLIVKSFAHLRHLACTYPKRFMAPLLKGSYMMFVKTCRKTNIRTLPKIAMMTGCIVDAYGLDADASYQHAFIYIRQMAIHLRNAVATKTKESFRQVYHWQYINSIKVWGAVLVKYAGKSTKNVEHPLASLVYPFVQIALGIVRLVPTVQFMPLHLTVLSTLSDLVEACHVHIPLTAHYLTMLDLTVTTKSKPSTLKPLYLPAFLKAPKQYQGTRVFLNAARQGAYLGLLRYLALQTANLGFPELAIPAVAGLRAHIKRAHRDQNWVKTIQAFANKVTETRQSLSAMRQKADLVPSNADALVQFMANHRPEDSSLGKFWAGVQKVEAQRAATLAKSFMDEESVNAAQQKNRGESDSEDSTDLDDAGSVGDNEAARKKPIRRLESKKSALKESRKLAMDDDDEDADDFLQGVDVVMDDESD